ncbi:MAG: 2Fe-2S iron-sulfur cluster binding domain-containing protein [Treponema sp.]|nr:2Fe-2S iron-sulfur cluster binding domain-containing protein [Treponema sp.]
MKIPVTLNGTKTDFEADPDESLMKVLRKYKCMSVKEGCNKGFCGSCTVLLDNNPVASCKVPVGLVKDGDIVTLDYFRKTEECLDILKGFSKAGIKLCGYCDAGKIFTTYEILKMNKMPSRKEITEKVRHLSPCCTDLETLVNGILYAINIRNSNYERITVPGR